MNKTRPDSLQGKTHRIKTNAGNLFVTVNHDAEGRPLEVFIRVGKHGGDLGPYVDSIAKLTSLLLRCGISIDRIAKQLDTADADQVLPNVPDAVASILRGGKG